MALRGSRFRLWLTTDNYLRKFLYLWGVEVKQPQGSLDKAVIQLLAFFIAHFVKLEQSFEGLGCHIWLPSIVIVYSQPRLSYILHCKAGQILNSRLGP
ncbi:uncharacterized protein ASPGLDRAFT_45387 [Aspergillus glaucus CBS 516.65]|uniref:Uncharacterized protein n=1 Tax=Aspergillus glaucus CBS 516.65 TaxID=1160497 RepID=A0A1L9VNG1_ASPGL|nr:hypothetical protein ASPGLDRAFT_45387 [Aspergillus glaucus CBS 516.65]OJJ85420.1 hypothetical protein ASPGLDRAFT_45387 [Aspergillus glaucus CBS 516.65]